LSGPTTRRTVEGVFGDARRAVVVGGVLVFAFGVLVGYLLGAGSDDGLAVASPSPSIATTGPTGVTAPPAVVSPVIDTPPPEADPGISTAGQVLAEGARPLVAAPAGAACQALVTPGSIGECGESAVAGGRVIWVVERTATTTGTTAVLVRVFVYVASEGGWVEWLVAADPTGERWSDVNVLTSDLTGDAVAELVVGFRGVDEAQTLEYDVVGYDQDGLPLVLAHPDPSARGAVVVTAGQLQDYGAQYPNGEPACCPPSYLHRTIAYDGGFFRVVTSETVPPNVVPASQL
jgi:hypothetical protein